MNNKKVVWVIDKDRDYQDTLRLQLEQFSHALQVISIYDAEEALKLLQASQHQTTGTLPDIILLDLNMPVMDGWEFLNEYIGIKDTLPHSIDIYIVTSSIRKQDMKEANNYKEVRAYKTKPLDMHFFENLL